MNARQQMSRMMVRMVVSVWGFRAPCHGWLLGENIEWFVADFDTSDDFVRRTAKRIHAAKANRHFNVRCFNDGQPVENAADEELRDLVGCGHL